VRVALNSNADADICLGEIRHIIGAPDAIELPCYDIVITLDGNGWGTITSSLKGDDEAYDTAIDGLESTILAHACAGINVSAPAYIEGIETAVDAIANHYGLNCLSL